MITQFAAVSAFDSLRQTFGELPVDIAVAFITIIGALLGGHLLNHLLRTHLKGSSIGAISLVTNIVRAVIAILVVFFLGESVFDIKMSGVVQALGVTTLVVSLGLQDLIKSVVAGMLIVAGDIVTVGDQVIMVSIAVRSWISTGIKSRFGIVMESPMSYQTPS